ncbi:hypothetical protein B0H10DRAFT_2108927 [Mycena sp. CBHHK59/15]|nr:hypothetical protein B0H10DRAFT_2157788 [Mycena sp. CBHHK59/15]KAJ6569961.1 hypothetical protein B0H10DRAFT_2108927 [Mycena sp. CBHHK59/15]
MVDNILKSLKDHVTILFEEIRPINELRGPPALFFAATVRTAVDESREFHPTAAWKCSQRRTGSS